MLVLLCGCILDGFKFDSGSDDTSRDTSDSAPRPRDADGDGYRASDGDCNDSDASVNPGAVEICDGYDQNCDGQIDEGVTSTFYVDFDGDGFGDASWAMDACEPPVSYVPNGDDCDDAEARVYPGAVEVCDGLDNDCDGQIDDELSGTYYADADGDGYGDPNNAVESCSVVPGYVTDSSDCDDTTALCNPGNTETCDELDNDCDGTVDEGVTSRWYADRDGDGSGDRNLTQDACSQPPGYVADGTDPDDTDSAVP